MTNSLIRFNDNLWGLPKGSHSCTDIHPDCEVHFEALNYRVARVGQRALEQLGSYLLKQDTTWIRLPHEMTPRWKIGKADQVQGWFQKIKNSMHMFRATFPPHILRLKVEAVTLKENEPIPPSHVVVASEELPEALRIDNSFEVNELDEWNVSDEPYSDPYTQLATEAFQTWECEFATRRQACPSLQYVLEDQNLHLAPCKKDVSDVDQRYANRRVLRHYILWVNKEYGRPIIRDLEHRYEIDFKGMYERGEPLTPEVIYRINVGVNNLELQHLKNLLHKLEALYADLQIFGLQNETLDEFLHWYDKAARSSARLPRRETRGLRRVLCASLHKDTPSTHELATFLHEILGSPPKNKVSEIKAEHFDLLTQILWPPQEVWSRQFTGREITHKAIMGFYTIADREQFKPWLDQHELLQVLPQCRESTEWIPYLELITHIVSKKHLVRRHPDDQWRVGALIPALKSEQGQPRWYVVTSCLDNHRGIFNYTLEPATKDTKLPFVKLYRSTASSRYAMNGWSSIIADMDPKYAPGGRKKWKGEKYELQYIKDRTIPIWVGYFLKGQQIHHRQLMTESQEKNSLRRCHLWRQATLDYHKAVIELCEGRVRELSKPFEVTDDNRPHMKQILQERKLAKTFWNNCLQHYKKQFRELPEVPRSVPHDRDHVLHELEYTFKKLTEEYEVCLGHIAESDQELPKFKKPQDIYFAGHSLGGGQAQGALFHFGPFRERIPVPGHRFVCYATNSVAMKAKENDDFLRFGEEHKELLKALGSRWKLIFSMEYGDIIPLGGDCHLGATYQHPDEYKDWLDFEAVFFTPNPASTHLEVFDPPTHGKRFGRAIPKKDFSKEVISAQELRRFNETAWMSREQRKKWGLPLLLTPRTAEWLRKTIGWISIPYNVWWKKIWEWFNPPRGHEIRDSNHYFFCSLTEECQTQLEDLD